MNKYLLKNEEFYFEWVKKSFVYWTPFIFPLLLAFLTTLQNIGHPMSNGNVYSDYSIYQYIGKVISHGGMPYRDVFDHKGPVFYFINFLGYLIHPFHGIWLLETYAMFIGWYFAYKFCRLYLSSFSSMFVLLLGSVSMTSWGYWIGNTPESWSFSFLMFVMYVAVLYFKNGNITKFHTIMLGVVFSCLFLMKPTMIAFYVPFVIYILFDCILKENKMNLLRYLGKFLIGAAIVIVPIFTWLLVKGALVECFDCYFLFNLQYSKEFAGGNQILVVWLRFLSLPFVKFGIWSGVFIFFSFKKLKKKDVCLAGITAIDFIFTLWVIGKPGRDFMQYTIELYPCLLIMIVIGIYSLRTYFMKRETIEIGRIVKFLMVVFLCHGILIPCVKQTKQNISQYWSYNSNYQTVVQYIINNTKEKDCISVASPDDAGIYLYTNRNAAVRFCYTQGGIMNGMLRKDILQEYFNQIDLNKPEIIVASSNCKAFTQMIFSNILTPYTECFTCGKFILFRKV